MNPWEQEYNDLRVSALQASGAMGDNNHPCIEGQGECCKHGGAGFTYADARVITDAISAGEIDIRIIDEDIKRCGNHSICPFLLTDNKCSIYHQRPLLCIVTGVGGGEINPNKDYSHGVPFTDVLVNTICAECRKILCEKGMATTLRAVDLYRKAVRYILDNYTGSTDKILDLYALKHLVRFGSKRLEG